ncbi:hypothetical protein PANT_12c00021 [Moesziomyces antarcticus T-34]|uniref:Uncharacterized protein n=1 Tax=Pseudozyma antarctica (strain T-34) TaxID=1151754 RepID=M9MFR5_PSEA3|nr:hypothetical protein PANT_12c00021 [Moesziomyces antarcticus T-34]
MPTATRPKPTAPSAKRRPSGAARSESGYSRRSSLGSFKTAAGASDYNPAISASEQDDDEDEDELASDEDATMIRKHHAPRHLEDDDETETVSHHEATPKGLVAPNAEDSSSVESQESPAIFNHNTTSDTETINKSPPTSHDDAVDQRSPLDKSKAARQLLTPDTALTPKGKDRKNVRASHASHLTLPYQRSEAGDMDASRRLSKMTMQSYGRRAPSRAESFVDDMPDMSMRDARYRSVSERGGGSRASRLAPPASVLEFGGASTRSSFQSQRGPGSRYASSYIEPHSLRSPSKRDFGSPAGIHHRDSDRLSISSRRTARKPASVVSKMLDADTQVYPGTRIRKYIEPQLNEAMRRVMKQFAGHGLHDHRCNGYPIAVFVGATAIDTGSIIQPHVSGAVSMYFGPGHPKNMATLLPGEDRVPSHIPNPKAPTPASLSRRAELRSAITALHTIYEMYRGRACAHVCIDSAYVAKAWGTWIPTWELRGWPGEDDQEAGDEERWEEEYYERRRNQRRVYDRYGARYEDRRDGYASDGGRFRRDAPRRRYDDDWLASDPYADRDRSRRRGGGQRRSRGAYDYSSDEDEYDRRDRRRYDERDDRRRRPMRRAPGRRLVDEDLLRELADIRYEFARAERGRHGSAHLYLIDRSNNPADRMARAVAKSDGNLLRQELEALHVDDAAFSDDELLDPEEEEWEETRSRFSSTSNTKGRMSSRNSSRGSIISNATGRLRPSASMPSGRLREGARRQLDTFAEEDEDEIDDARSVRSARSAKSAKSARSKKSTRAERERDEYLARQERMDAEALAAQRRSVAGKRSASRASHLAPPASERGGGSRRSMDSRAGRMSTDMLSPEAASRRGSMDTRRVSAVRSQPDIRGSGRASVRGALASAAVREDDVHEEYYRPSMQVHRDVSGGPRHPSHMEYPEMDDLVPPARAWDGASMRSRSSVDSRRGGLFARKHDSPKSERKFGMFSNRSTPSLRAPAPEDPDYEWKAKRKGGRKQRDWNATTADDYAQRSQWDADAEERGKKPGFFGRMFGRK